MTISILGILCGADDWIVINLWAACNLSWLQEHGICLNGIPSHVLWEDFSDTSLLLPLKMFCEMDSEYCKSYPGNYRYRR